MIFSTSFIFVALLFATCVSGDEVLVTDKVVADRLPEYCFEKYSSTTSGSNLLHKEQPCEDDLPKTISDPNVCASLFQKTGTPADQTKTDALCINPNYQQEILWCAKTCKLCCLRSEYSCSDRPPAADPDQCVNLKKNNECEKEPQKAKFCLRSCGKCETEKDHCEDRHLGCEYMKGMCLEENHKIKMGRICPRTCDKENNNHSACTKIAELHHFRKEHVPIKKDCNDSGSGCAKNIMLCEDEYYIDKMARHCQSTCGRCVKPDFVCEDKKGSPCDIWKSNKFCDVDGIYPKGVMLQHCAKTCDICPK